MLNDEQDYLIMFHQTKSQLVTKTLGHTAVEGVPGSIWVPNKN